MIAIKVPQREIILSPQHKKAINEEKIVEKMTAAERRRGGMNGTKL